MTGGGVPKSKALLLRDAKQVEGGLRKKWKEAAGVVPGGAENSRNITGGKIEEASFWVPHPKTGIYYPKGHEWVMEDMPEGAASFSQTYWLRNNILEE